MKKYLVLVMIAASCTTASAHPDELDDLVAIGTGTKIVFPNDINIPGNRQSIYFYEGKRQYDSLASRNCELSVSSASFDRVIPAGAEFSVIQADRVHRYGSYDDYYWDETSKSSLFLRGATTAVRSVFLIFQSKSVLGIICSNRMWTLDRAANPIDWENNIDPTIGDLRTAFGDNIEIIFPKPVVIESAVN